MKQQTFNQKQRDHWEMRLKTFKLFSSMNWMKQYSRSAGVKVRQVHLQLRCSSQWIQRVKGQTGQQIHPPTWPHTCGVNSQPAKPAFYPNQTRLGHQQCWSIHGKVLPPIGDVWYCCWTHFDGIWQVFRKGGMAWDICYGVGGGVVMNEYLCIYACIQVHMS